MREQQLRPVLSSNAVHAQATAVMRERGLGAVDTEGRDYASDVTTEQQKALSGVAKRGGQQQPNAHLNRRAGRQGRPKKVTDIASSALHGDSSVEADASVTADHFNSSAQFADSGKLQSQEGTSAASKSTAAKKKGGLVKQGGTNGAEGGSALGDSAVGAQRAAQKFKLPSGKVLMTRECSLRKRYVLPREEPTRHNSKSLHADLTAHTPALPCDSASKVGGCHTLHAEALCVAAD